MNKIFLIGNLTKDPQTSTSASGVNNCRFDIAVRKKGKEEGAEFFPIVCFRGLADICSSHLSKGEKIAVVGTFSTGSYTNSQGQTIKTFSVIADDVEFLSPKKQECSNEPRGLEPEETPVGGLPF